MDTIYRLQLTRLSVHLRLALTITKHYIILIQLSFDVVKNIFIKGENILN